MIPGYLAGQLRDRPQIGDYRWRARMFPLAEQANKRAEAQHGEPVPTCLCGGRITYTHKAYGGRCDACGQSPLDSARKGPS